MEKGRRKDLIKMSDEGDPLIKMRDLHDESDSDCAAHGDYPGTEGLVVLVCALLAGLLAKVVLSKSKIPYTVLLTVFGGIMGVIHKVSG